MRPAAASVDKREKVGGSSSGPREGGVISVAPQPRSAMAVSTVYGCVEFIAAGLASLPFQYMRRKDEIFVPDNGTSYNDLLNVEPNPSINAVDFWKMVVRYLLLRGNAYILPVYDYVLTPGVKAFHLLDPDSVCYDPLQGKYTVTDVNGVLSGDYDEEEVIHIKNYSTDGKIGISTLEHARVTVGISQVGNGETLDRFQNGGRVRGIVSNDTKNVQGFGEYQDKELSKTAESIDGRFRKGESIVSIPGQVQFNPVALSSTDMQFLESRKFNVSEICRFFRVHPSFVFHDTSSNYKSAGNAYAAFLSGTLNPLLRQIEVEFKRKLIPSSLWSKRQFTFMRVELYASDLEGRVKYQSETIASGIYTINEWRKIENRPPVPGGDTLMVSANLKSIEEFKKNE